MGPQDHLRALLDGFVCAVCDERISADRVRLLARRDDLVFVQFECAGCGSTTLGFITEEVTGHRTGRPETDRLAGAAVVSTDDVLDMHALLESWTGDLLSLVRGSGASRTRPTGPGDGQTGQTAWRPDDLA